MLCDIMSIITTMLTMPLMLYMVEMIMNMISNMQHYMKTQIQNIQTQRVQQQQHGSSPVDWVGTILNVAGLVLPIVLSLL